MTENLERILKGDDVTDVISGSTDEARRQGPPKARRSVKAIISDIKKEVNSMEKAAKDSSAVFHYDKLSKYAKEYEKVAKLYHNQHKDPWGFAGIRWN